MVLPDQNLLVMQDMGLGKAGGWRPYRHPLVSQDRPGSQGMGGGGRTPNILSRWPEMIFQPHKSWSRGGGSTTIPERCGLQSGASEINIVGAAFGSKSFLLPSLPSGPRKRCGGGKRHQKRKGSVILKGLQPSRRPRAILGAACSQPSAAGTIPFYR